MYKLSIYHAAIAQMLCFTLSAPAASQQQTIMPPELVSAVGRWGECQAKQKDLLSSESLSPTARSEAIMQGCADYENQFAAMLAKKLGEVRSTPMVAKLREQFRAAIQNDFDQLNGVAALPDPAGDWGKCFGQKMQELATIDDTAFSLRTKGMAACKSYEQTVWSITLKRYGLAAAQNEANGTKQVMLEMAEKYLNGAYQTP